MSQSDAIAAVRPVIGGCTEEGAGVDGAGALATGAVCVRGGAMVRVGAGRGAIDGAGVGDGAIASVGCGGCTGCGDGTALVAGIVG